MQLVHEFVMVKIILTFFATISIICEQVRQLAIYAWTTVDCLCCVVDRKMPGQFLLLHCRANGSKNRKHEYNVIDIVSKIMLELSALYFKTMA